MPCSHFPQKAWRTRSETATTATTLPSCRVGGSGCDILDTSNAHAGTGKSTESRLGSGAGGLGAVSTSGSDLDVESGDAEFLAAGSYSKLIPGALRYLLMMYTHRRPGLPTWRRMGRTRHGRP